ncbi:hypothetical protein H0H10_00315 [Streptomyces sp. TRM S81-3]|uniref:Uncharacterized protein n=1 Tax=Streptomyces griseicoloratus TaxID=2752516 RepID=A0A926KVK3_9ACTN|nr:hypothetical protein [Streptomyces griseicoloratus]MBD0417645.1 hypothetical protein [Streptomyces griseicoloratus]
MTGSPPYWNEDTQSWEDHDTPGPPSPPPPGSTRSAGPGGSGRRVLWTVLAAAAAVVVASGVALVRLTGDDDGDRADSRPAATRTGGPTAPESTGPGSGGPSTPPASPALPDGYELVHEQEEGFGAAVPRGWTRDTDKEPTDPFVVDYDDPAPGSRAFVRFSELSGSDPEQSLEEVRYWEGFEELAPSHPLDGENGPAYGVEYSFRSDGETWYAVEIHFRASDGSLYGVAAFDVDADLTEDRVIARTARQHFCPPGAPGCAEDQNSS